MPFLSMTRGASSLISVSRTLLRASLAVLAVNAITSCSDATGPAIARTFSLYTLDRNSLPAAIKGTDGRTMTVGVGRLQGTDEGPSCGMSLQLISGPITSTEIPNCKLTAGKEITFTATLSDPRFPSGPHEYRFVPP